MMAAAWAAALSFKLVTAVLGNTRSDKLTPAVGLHLRVPET